MNYIDYIKEHKDDINATCKKVSYKDIYKKSFDNIDNVVFKEALIEFKEKENGELKRGDIFNVVENGDLLKAFFLIMLWGGIREKNLKSTLLYINKVGEQKIRGDLKRVSNLVNEGKVSDAFTLLKDGECHIDGVGVSFFTKLLFFFDNTKLGERALIFDRWSKKEHCALLISDNTVDYKNYYTLIKSGNKVDAYCNVSKEQDLFIDYNKRMKDIASIIGQPNVGLVEEYLFGIPKSRQITNPRIFLDNFLYPYCKEDIWIPFDSFYDLKNTGKHSADGFCGGYCIPLNGDKFRICVIDEGRKRDYRCLIFYKWQQREDWGKGNDRWNEYPDAEYIFNEFSPENRLFNMFSERNWINRSKDIKSYKYLKFNKNKDAAISFMEQVKVELQRLYEKK